MRKWWNINIGRRESIYIYKSICRWFHYHLCPFRLPPQNIVVGSQKNRHLFSPPSGGLSLRCRCQQHLVLERTLFLACRWPPSCCVLMWWGPRGASCLMSHFIRAQSHREVRSPCPHLSLISSQSPISKCSHIGEYEVCCNVCVCVLYYIYI